MLTIARRLRYFLDIDSTCLSLQEDCVIFLDIDSTCLPLQEDCVIFLDIDCTCLPLQEDCVIFLDIDSALFYYFERTRLSFLAEIVFIFNFVKRSCYPI